MPKTTEVWVLAEHKDGKLADISLELLDEGRRLAAQVEGDLCAVMLGDRIAELATPLAHYGADKVYLAEDESLQTPSIESVVEITEAMIRDYSPAIVLFGSTALGRDLAPCVAARVKAGLAVECSLFKVNDQCRLHVTRPVYGGKLDANCVFATKATIQIATIRPGLIGFEKPDESRKPELVRVKFLPKKGGSRTKIVGLIKGDPETIDLCEAEIIVAAGKGVGGMERMGVVKDLAAALRAPLAGTRQVVDLGWVPRERLVGITGKSVSPNLYIACGISGASQHMQGMRSSKHIIAINTDRTAPILKIADIGIVGDLHNTVPAITKRVRQLVDSGKTVKPETLISSIQP